MKSTTDTSRGEVAQEASEHHKAIQYELSQIYTKAGREIDAQLSVPDASLEGRLRNTNQQKIGRLQELLAELDRTDPIGLVFDDIIKRFPFLSENKKVTITILDHIRVHIMNIEGIYNETDKIEGFLLPGNNSVENLDDNVLVETVDKHQKKLKRNIIPKRREKMPSIKKIKTAWESAFEDETVTLANQYCMQVKEKHRKRDKVFEAAIFSRLCQMGKIEEADKLYLLLVDENTIKKHTDIEVIRAFYFSVFEQIVNEIYNTEDHDITSYKDIIEKFYEQEKKFEEYTSCMILLKVWLLYCQEDKRSAQEIAENSLHRKRIEESTAGDLIDQVEKKVEKPNEFVDIKRINNIFGQLGEILPDEISTWLGEESLLQKAKEEGLLKEGEQ